MQRDLVILYGTNVWNNDKEILLHFKLMRLIFMNYSV